MSNFAQNNDSGWPDYERFPYNYLGKSVHSIIWKDLQESENPFIITGYASLDNIINFFDERYKKLTSNPELFQEIRLLLGNEPYPTKKNQFFSSHKFAQEIQEYWQNEGVSILNCGKVIAAIELIKAGKVDSRIAEKKPIHAKIYQGDHAVTLGSSNFSNSGLIHQIEANVRFTQKKENKRFHETCDLASEIWELGRPYNEELIKLIESLVSKVGWQEALAKACAELLEGNWAKKYKSTNYLSEDYELWPSQEKGIAEAIWVIQNVGSVLIADATGSGKTRMGTHLIKAVMNQIWATGRMRKGSPLLICPPSVQVSWDKEFINSDLNIQTYSHGLLSKSTSNKQENIFSAISHGQVLAVDEAHNFFNRTTNRTQALFGNMADYVLLFTATPINRGAQDLLSLIQLLGADNFDDDLLNDLKPLWKKQDNDNEIMVKYVRKKARDAIQQFTVRRTKKMLNQMIEEEPERYKDRFGKLCRYPKHKSLKYPCGETENDRALASQIRKESEKLLGLANLIKPIKLPDYLRKEGWTDELYLKWRLKSAKILAGYNIIACLRSSRAALLEHLYGTKAAQKCFDIPGIIKQEDTGNLIEKLEDIAGKPPENLLDVELPDWLYDPAKHKEACLQEREVYNDIGKLCMHISEAREETKAQRLTDLLKHHKLLLAFDHRLITLHDLKKRLQYPNVKTIVATGATQKECKEINDNFQLGSSKSGIIALCSDAMSEGVNLQQASAVVQLDMPSVIRLAEQRIGRIDRMDSPFSEIEAWWPQDSDEFALRSSEQKFFQRHQLVTDLLGSNLPLPEDFSPSIDIDSSKEPVKLEEIIHQVDNEDKQGNIWQLGDVFDPVRALVEGKKILINPEVYKQVIRSRNRSVLSVVKADYTWAFFAISGTEWGAPRWVYMDDINYLQPITDLQKICENIRKHLYPLIEEEPLETALPFLEYFIKKLICSEEQLLPKKKQRALQEMREVLQQYQSKANKNNDENRQLVVKTILSRFEEKEPRKQSVDLSLLAESWLDLIRPWWLARLNERKRSEPLRLKDIRQDLIENPLSTEKLNEILKVPDVKPLDERIVSAIIGI